MLTIDQTYLQKLENGFEREWFATDSGYVIKEGTGFVMISAPHSVSQWRTGQYKQGEYKTGVLAEWLHEDLRCPVIYKTNNLQDDANWDIPSAYKQALIAYVNEHRIQTLYDLHISSATRDFDVDLGTGYGQNVFDAAKVDTVINAFQANGLNDVKVNAIFPAAKENTVSASVAKACGIDCIQIELNWRHLDTSMSCVGFKNVYNTLKQLVLEGGTNS